MLRRAVSLAFVLLAARGSGMTYEYLRRRPDAPIAAWAALSFYGVFEDLARAPYPVLDLYGSSDYRGIRSPADKRKRVLDTRLK